MEDGRREKGGGSIYNARNTLLPLAHLLVRCPEAGAHFNSVLERVYTCTDSTSLGLPLMTSSVWTRDSPERHDRARDMERMIFVKWRTQISGNTAFHHSLHKYGKSDHFWLGVCFGWHIYTLQSGYEN